MNTKNLSIIAVTLVVLAAIAAFAFRGHEGRWRGHDMMGQMQGHDMMDQMQGQMESQMQGHDMMAMGTPKGDQGEASKAYAKANLAMHTGMDIEFTGNPDVDFAKGMIPHHQGAIDMAKIVLQYGKDPDIRKLAEGVVTAQEGEITFMKDWLAKNAK